MILFEDKLAGLTGGSSCPAASDAPGRNVCLPLDRYEAHYQPMIHLGSGRVEGYEALARQRLDSGKVISAGALFFNPGVPVEQKLQLDRMLRRQALECFGGQPEQGFVSVNISPDWVDMLTEDAVSPTIKMVHRAGIDPGRVLVEITECNGGIKNLQRLANQYQRAGFKLAIDDFGVGASQVDRLIALQPDYIKLDMDLFRRAARGGAEANVALAITSLAQRAGCKIICEGVETEQEFHFAIECGADLIQGWLFDAALPELRCAGYYESKVNRLKQSYLQRKSNHLEASFEHNRNVADQVRHLGAAFSECGSLQKLGQQVDLQHLRQLGIVRCYLCDTRGNQLFDNLEFDADNLRDYGQYEGYNWSHRPYFAQLMAMQRLQSDHLVVSTPYKDISSGSFCKTFAIVVSKDLVLLFDVRVNDEVLFHGDAQKSF